MVIPWFILVVIDIFLQPWPFLHTPFFCITTFLHIQLFHPSRLYSTILPYLKMRETYTYVTHKTKKPYHLCSIFSPPLFFFSLSYDIIASSSVSLSVIHVLVQWCHPIVQQHYKNRILTIKKRFSKFTFLYSISISQVSTNAYYIPGINITFI